MFCDKCGNSLIDGSRFCDKCGNEICIIESNKKETGTGMASAQYMERGVGFAGSLIASVVAIISMLFQKWIEIEPLSIFGDSKYTQFSLFQVFDVISNVSQNILSFTDELDGHILMAYVICIVLLILNIGCIVSVGLHIIFLCTNNKKDNSAKAFTDYLILVVLIHLILFFVNAWLSDVINTSISIFSVVQTAYFNLVVLGINIFFSKMRK